MGASRTQVGVDEKKKRGSSLCVRLTPYSKHCDYFFAGLILFGHNYIMALVPRTLEAFLFTPSLDTAPRSEQSKGNILDARMLGELSRRPARTGPSGPLGRGSLRRRSKRTCRDTTEGRPDEPQGSCFGASTGLGRGPTETSSRFQVQYCKRASFGRRAPSRLH